MNRALWLMGTPARIVLLGLLRGYRTTISPALGQRCRFFPSCAVYAEEAVRTHGALKGSALALWRVLRCSPLSSGGPDPVPQRSRKRTGRTPAASVYDAVIRG
jgi:putative membrane protein insertion efficiency factor